MKPLGENECKKSDWLEERGEENNDWSMSWKGVVMVVGEQMSSAVTSMLQLWHMEIWKVLQKQQNTFSY